MILSNRDHIFRDHEPCLWVCVAVLSALLALSIPVKARGTIGRNILSETGDWIAAISLMFASHEYGHQRQADDLAVPMSWTFNNGGPHWFEDYSKDLTIVEIRKNISQAERETYTVGILRGDACKGIKNCQVLSRPLGNDMYTVEYPNAHGIQYEVPRKQTLIAGAGFRGQQTTAKLLEGSKLQRKYLVISALNKVGYALYPKSLQPGTGLGDVNTFQFTKSKDVAQIALYISGAIDLWKAFKNEGLDTWSLDFWQSENGSPGLMFTCKF